MAIPIRSGRVRRWRPVCGAVGCARQRQDGAAVGDCGGDTGRAVDGPAWRDRHRGVQLLPGAYLRSITSGRSWSDQLKPTGTRWRIQDTAQQASIEDRETGARVKVIGSDPKRAHGLAPVLVLADEPAQWPASTGERMVAALRTSAGKQPHFRFVALGTRPASDDHWFAKMLAGGSDYRPGARGRSRRSEISAWRRGARRTRRLTHMPDLRAAIETEAKHARSDPAMVPGIRRAPVEPRHRRNRDGAAVGRRHLDAGSRARPTGPGRAFGASISALRRRNPRSLPIGRTSGRLECRGGVPGAARRLPSADSGDGVGTLYQSTWRGAATCCTLGGQRGRHRARCCPRALTRFGRPAVLAADRWREAGATGRARQGGRPAGRARHPGPRASRTAAKTCATFGRACLEGRVVPAPVAAAALGDRLRRES